MRKAVGCRPSPTFEKSVLQRAAGRKIGSEERTERPKLGFRHVVPKDGRICHTLELSVYMPGRSCDRRQVTLDQHHGLSPRRWHAMFILQRAPFPTESAPHIAAILACSRNARAHPPDRPVSLKSRCPRKAERGVRVIARDPQCWLSLSSINQRASTKWPQGVANKN